RRARPAGRRLHRAADQRALPGQAGRGRQLPRGDGAALPAGRARGQHRQGAAADPFRGLAGQDLLAQPAAGERSSHAHGEPYAVSKSRNGRAGSASGPSTPVPVQAPESISSSATTGLTAVCHTTAWEPYSAIVQALSTT